MGTKPDLLCPVCGLTPRVQRHDSGRPAALVCPAGHRYDAARQGHVNLLTGRGSRHREDTPEMVASREAWLGSGHYAPIASAVADAVVELAPPGPLLLADTGAGTGYYTSAVLTRLHEAQRPARAVTMDLSRAAAQRAAADPRVLSLVWDTWSPWPLAARSVQVLLDVFAPRNAAEFRRVVAPGGVAVVVVPAEDHLAALREDAGLLGVDEHKQERLSAVFDDGFRALGVTDVAASMLLTRQEAADLAHMGPAGHHHSRDEILAGLPDATRSVDLHVTVHAYRRQDRPNG